MVFWLRKARCMTLMTRILIDGMQNFSIAQDNALAILQVWIYHVSWNIPNILCAPLTRKCYRHRTSSRSILRTTKRYSSRRESACEIFEKEKRRITNTSCALYLIFKIMFYQLTFESCSGSQWNIMVMRTAEVSMDISIMCSTRSAHGHVLCSHWDPKCVTSNGFSIEPGGWASR